MMHSFSKLVRDAAGCVGAARGGSANIIFVLADDLGITDLAYCGSRYYETPHLARLAKQGRCVPICRPFWLPPQEQFTMRFL